MSNIANKNNIFGNSYNVTIGNGTEEQMSKLNNISLYNSIIISIPQENEADIPGEASIWLTDIEGNLYQVSRPINKIKDIVNECIDERYDAINSDLTAAFNNIVTDRISEDHKGEEGRITQQVENYLNAHLNSLVQAKVEAILNEQNNTEDNN